MSKPMKLMGESASVDAIVMKIRTGEKMHNKMKARGYVRQIYYKYSPDSSSSN